MCEPTTLYALIVLGVLFFIYAYLFWIFQYPSIIIKIKDANESLYRKILYGKSATADESPENTPIISINAAYRCHEYIESGDVERAGISISPWYKLRVRLLVFSMTAFCVCIVMGFAISGCE